MRLFVFGGKKNPVLPQAPRYAIINMFAIAQTLLISLALARWVLPALGVIANTGAVAHSAGALVPVFTSYFGHKLLTFR